MYGIMKSPSLELVQGTLGLVFYTHCSEGIYFRVTVTGAPVPTKLTLNLIILLGGVMARKLKGAVARPFSSGDQVKGCRA